MSSIVQWNSQEGWSDWINEEVDGRSPRIVGSALKLPFNRCGHHGTGNITSQRIARWSWGQRETLNSDFVNDDDTVDPLVGGNIDHSSTPSGAVELSEYGINFVNRNAYSNIFTGSGDGGTLRNDFDYPDNANGNFYVSCWVKSHLTDYSSGFALISGYYDTWGVDGYALGITVDGRISAFIQDSGVWSEVSMCGEDTYVDTGWHHVLLVGSQEGASGRLWHTVIDNKVCSFDYPSGSGQKTSSAGRFTIGSVDTNTSLGFAGIVDELVVANWSGDKTNFSDEWSASYRHSSNSFMSPVFDSERENSLTSGIYVEYESPNDSSVQFSFRASDSPFDQNDSVIPWSGFTPSGLVLNSVNTDLSDFGIFTKGRYQQVRMKLDPSSEFSSISDPLQLDTPSVTNLVVKTSVSNKILGATAHAYESGTILGQIINFSGSKQIDKVSLNLSVTKKEQRSFIVGKGDTLSFQAGNFQDGRHEWAFQPVINWGDDEWETSGTTIRNYFQNGSWTDINDVITNAPYLKYSLFFPKGGLYDLWGYGYVNGNGIYWTFDDDRSHLRRFTLGDDISGWQGVPKWTKFGSYFLEEGGLHDFFIYLGESNTTMLDQWYFTTDSNLQESIELSLPMPLSKSPFNTAVRMRSLYQGAVDDLETPQSAPTVNVTMWLPSRNISASGKFNYEVIDDSGSVGITATDGISVEFWQIGGSSSFFASWDYYKVN